MSDGLARRRGAVLLLNARPSASGGCQRLFGAFQLWFAAQIPTTFAGSVLEINALYHMSSPASLRYSCPNLLPCSSCLIHFFNQTHPSSAGIQASSSPRCQRQWCIIELEMPVLSGGGPRPYPMTQAGVQRWGGRWGGTVGTSESSGMWIFATASNMLDSNESMLAFPERPFVVHMPILSSLNLGQRLFCESNNKGDEPAFEVWWFLLMFSRNSLGQL